MKGPKHTATCPVCNASVAVNRESGKLRRHKTRIVEGVVTWEANVCTGSGMTVKVHA